MQLTSRFSERSSVRRRLGPGAGVVIAALVLSGCGGASNTPASGGSAGLDAAVAGDAGLPGPDSGVAPDAGMGGVTPDAGTSTTAGGDGGSPGGDASLSAPDSGGGTLSGDEDGGSSGDASAAGSDAGGAGSLDAASGGSSDGGGTGAADAGSGSGSADAGSGGSADAGSGGSADAGSGGSADAGSGDSGAVLGSDAGVGGGDAGLGLDAGSGGDAGIGDAGVCPAGTGCTLNGHAGLCKNNACVACTDPTDDTACTTAYGHGGTSYLCLAGTCTAGNCRHDSDCHGEICDLHAANTCGACTADTQCQSAAGYGAGFICSPATGTCVSGACGATNAPLASACPANGADVCCPVMSGGGMCVAGTCCVDGDCLTGQRCEGNTCTNCQAATGGVYYVDPTNGDDSAATGSQGCPFRSVTAALAFLGTSLTQDTTVTVIGGGAVQSPVEQFPIVVPRHVHITGSPAGTVFVPNGQRGFTLSAPSSGLSHLVIDGQGAGLEGIAALFGSDFSTTIDHVTVQNMTSNGISVRNSAGKGGMLRINAGVVSTANGTAANVASGLLVTGAGQVQIVGTVNASAADRIAFSANTNHGIVVNQSGALTITGTASIDGNGNVVANGNALAGLYIDQTPVASGSPPLNFINGLTANGNGTPTTAINGVHLFGGSNVRVRRTVALNNTAAGIRVDRFQTSSSTFNDDISMIDLGTNYLLDPGQNVVQRTVAGGAMSNAGTGICLDLSTGVTATLRAQGNTFSGGHTCRAAIGSGALTESTGCGQGTDLGLVHAGPSIDVANCTP